MSESRISPITAAESCPCSSEKNVLEIKNDNYVVPGKRTD